MTKEQCGDGYQAEKNYQSPQGDIIIHHMCKINYVQKEDQREAL